MKQIIDMDSILRELYRISGCRVSIHDTDCTEIAAYPRDVCPFCRLIQTMPEGHLACLKMDADALARVKRTEEPYIYRCHLGLWEAVAPLYSAGILSGYLMLGQIAPSGEGVRDDIFSRAAALLGEDSPDISSLKKTVAALSEADEEQFSSFVTIMRICADYITMTERLNPSEPVLAHAIRKYLTANYALKITLDDLCTQFCCCKSTLMNAFRAAYSSTIVEYLTEVRLSHARRMLAETNRSVRDVASLCGFSDQGYFTRVFSEDTGVSPTAFRKHMQSESTDAEVTK